MTSTTYGQPYFESVGTGNGINRLAHNTCRIIDFELLALRAGQKWTYSTAGRECAFDVLTGSATISVMEQQFAQLGGRGTVFDGPPSMVYAPSNQQVCIEALTDVEIGIGSATSDATFAPYAITPGEAITGQWGDGNTERHFRVMINGDRSSDRLWFTEVVVRDGCWATYPPHKHEDVPGDLFQEEMYFYKVSPETGFGFCGEFGGLVGGDYAFMIRNNTIHKMPCGYHTVTAAPGCQVFYLAVYAGRDKRHAPSPHPDFVNFRDNPMPEPFI